MSKTGKVWTVLSMLEWATDYFKNKDIADPRLSIEWILAEVLQIKRLDLYLQYDRPLSSEELESLRPMIKRRAAHEPLQYIIGSTPFVSVKIKVAPGVLIPRIETEQLVDLVLEQNRFRKNEPVRLLDLGTGSGCIPVAVKKEYPDWYCYGIDISTEALKIARENAEANKVDVQFRQADFTDAQSESIHWESDWDIIISNPPYITEIEKKEINRQVLEYEPHLALFHENPMWLYEKIIRFASRKKALLYLECNDKTAKEVEGISGQFFGHTSLQKDLDGNDRFLIASTRLIESGT
jgi:release factor glutamine methyltransferase